MAFDKQAALKAGYTEQEVNDYISKQPQNKSFTQGASDVFRSLGLGAFPDAGAAITGAIQGGITKNNPFITQDEFSKVKQEGQLNTVKNAAGLASWMVPETNVLKAGEGANLLTRVLASGANKAIQGAGQGALNAVSQGQNPIQGAGVGAVMNPAIAGAGALVTDTLPRYIGWRNYGGAGLKLPEVVQAENAAKAAGMDTLKQARSSILDNIKPFAMEGQPGYAVNSQTDRQAILNKITDLSNSSQWKGSSGLSDLVKQSRRAMASPQGVAPDIKTMIQHSSDLFDAYSQMTNYAKSLGAYGSKQDNTLASFLRSAAAITRQHLIDTSENPTALKTAMNNYAAQTAMNAGKGVGGNKATDLLGKVGLGGGGEAGIAGLMSMIPQLHGASVPLLLDTALTNSITGPPLARGLVNVGQKSQTSGASALLRRLGISGAQSVMNPRGQ